MTTFCAAFAVYSLVVYTSGTATPHLEPMSTEAKHGQQLWQDNNCIACHQFYGLGGYMGPDLTNVISNRGPLVAKAFIANGTAAMPDFDLADAEVDALVEFLEFVDQTGPYPPQNFEITWWGAVKQEDDPR